MTRKTVVVFTCVLAAILGPLAGCAAAATNLLAEAKWQYSVDGGKSWTAADAPPALTKETRATILARAELTAGDLAKVVCWELDAGGGYGQRISHQLNGKPVPVPLEGMEYRTIGAIPAETIQAGKNVLTVKVEYQGKRAGGRPLRLPKTLIALTEQDLKIVSGPVLGAITNNAFTVTCRTNMPATVTMSRFTPAGSPPDTLTPIPTTSKGLFHRFASLSYGTGPRKYQLVVRRGEKTIYVRGTVRLPAAGDKLRLVVLGDSRSNPPTWRKMSELAMAAKPDLVLHSGDLVKYGRSDWQWNEQLFGPAKEMFAWIPFYAVRGNHEAKAPLYAKLFFGPGPKGDPIQWSQELNGVLLIGIEAEADWSADSGNAKWLEKLLAGSQAKFIFLMSHYPAWTSGTHGKLGPDGRPREKPIRQGQDVIVPLLAKYKATAMFAGHDHLYERSELPGGLTHVVSGGAGAPLRGKVAGADEQNPHSKAFASKLHFCLIEAAGDTCTLRALTPGGEEIDRRTWSARPSP